MSECQAVGPLDMVESLRAQGSRNRHPARSVEVRTRGSREMGETDVADSKEPLNAGMPTYPTRDAPRPHMPASRSLPPLETLHTASPPVSAIFPSPVIPMDLQAPPHRPRRPDRVYLYSLGVLSGTTSLRPSNRLLGTHRASTDACCLAESRRAAPRRAQATPMNRPRPPLIPSCDL
ncbi:hypothetical protein HETIRDRAFT_109237 [Heterobasidion irregulare TC 32-1]|uniref:Uncharacterized protein n=1 Tax=Heterobasidion irregulare (strain TC 32-1) TaxID=747525 RepID=W4KHX2_HETIT|nr:uncharacterized protein HETIRDRAFT_109237 [Heterobasidion irregulare TC 32-1]ETW84915.1 hypothetical protein HETIRDRAFT_109237 [Heterobasidion irregulare TC 32-1]